MDMMSYMFKSAPVFTLRLFSACESCEWAAVSMRSQRSRVILIVEPRTLKTHTQTVTGNEYQVLECELK